MLGHDRVGLGWRPELAAGILANLDRVDVVEVIADDYVDAGRRELRALRTLAIQVPLVLHGISLGLASTTPVDGRRLDGLARVVGAVEPEAWTEHLAFVPALENVATLIDPPGSDRDEPAWLAHAVAATGGELLLDLHNLHANAVNFGFDAHAALARLPLSRVRFVHVAGGGWIGEDGGRRQAPPGVAECRARRMAESAGVVATTRVGPLHAASHIRTGLLPRCPTGRHDLGHLHPDKTAHPLGSETTTCEWSGRSLRRGAGGVGRDLRSGRQPEVGPCVFQGWAGGRGGSRQRRGFPISKTDPPIRTSGGCELANTIEGGRHRAARPLSRRSQFGVDRYFQ